MSLLPCLILNKTNISLRQITWCRSQRCKSQRELTVFLQSASKLSRALWRRGGKRKESFLLRLWNLNSTSNSPVVPRRLSCQISANRCEAETSANVKNIEKHVPRVMTSLLMSSPPISISHRLFRCGYSNSGDVVASSRSFSRPAARTLGELARRLYF